jgi:SPOR domain
LRFRRTGQGAYRGVGEEGAGAGGEPAAPPQPPPNPTAVSRAVLYEEDPHEKYGKRYVGSAIWSTKTVAPAPNAKKELVVVADISIPERRMKMTWSIRRNSDPALPASHTIDIMFKEPAKLPNGGIVNVPGVLMKSSEQARGAPLFGTSVKVLPGYFLIGLSALESNRRTNEQLLRQNAWFDIPFVYGNGKRAILALEKGAGGEAAYAAAFAAWRQTAPAVPAQSVKADDVQRATDHGHYFVQVGSQRTEADARAIYRALQSRYPGILNSEAAIIRRADLGSHGVYYRAMVGPLTTAEQATSLCSRLKAAGGQCMVQRN